MKLFKSIRLSYLDLEDLKNDPEIQKAIKPQSFDGNQGDQCLNALIELRGEEVTVVINNNPNMITTLEWEQNYKTGILTGPTKDYPVLALGEDRIAFVENLGGKTKKTITIDYLNKIITLNY